MSRAIRFRRIPRDPYLWSVSFSYDPEAVEIIKSHSSLFRAWVPEDKVWEINDMIADALVEDFKRAGFVIFGYEQSDRSRSSAGGYRDPFDTPWDEPPPPPPRQPPRSSSSDWCGVLFDAVGPTRREAVFKALTRVLHPDNGSTGDTRLMQDLNATRARWK